MNFAAPEHVGAYILFPSRISVSGFGMLLESVRLRKEVLNNAERIYHRKIGAALQIKLKI